MIHLLHSVRFMCALELHMNMSIRIHFWRLFSLHELSPSWKSHPLLQAMPRYRLNRMTVNHESIIHVHGIYMELEESFSKKHKVGLLQCYQGITVVHFGILHLL